MKNAQPTNGFPTIRSPKWHGITRTAAVNEMDMIANIIVTYKLKTVCLDIRIGQSLAQPG